MFTLSQIDKTWTLFLDRDGVLNYENQGTYVRNWDEFIFYPQTPENIKYFNSRFNRTILTTNQRGISRGIMKLSDLEDIHANMIREIELAGGKMDKIYFCLDMEAGSPCRKPNPGMAIQAAQDFPDIELHKSLMIGNNISDMMFGRNAGMKTVFLKTTNPDPELPNPAVDLYFKDLVEFTKALKKS